MQINWTIDIGSFIAAIGMIGTTIAMIFGWIRVGFTVGSRLSAVEEKLGQMSDVLIKLARQDERLKNLEDDINHLRHGRGFILELPNRVTPP